MRASRLSLIAWILIALTASGCMRRAGPLAVASPVVLTANDLDSFAYNRVSCRGADCPSPPPSRAMAQVQAKSQAQPQAKSQAMPQVSAQPTQAYAYAAAAPDVPYRLDAGDKLRVVVFGQEGLTNTYAVDAGGSITMPLIGAVLARGLTPAALAASITAKLKNGYIREPYVAAEVETYRPFFILGEVAAPGQYPYVPSMSVESAIAIAGGFTPRAKRSGVELTRNDGSGPARAEVPLGTPLRPGDTILVGERWF